MSTILDKIVHGKRQEVAAAKASRSVKELRAALPDAPPTRDFFGALASDRPGPDGDGGPIKLIAEVKRASPSAGLIREDFDAATIAKTYEAGGASCLSVLTDEPHFQGSLEYLQQARAACRLPVLRKDFILDEHQVVEARVAGADAILLIAECLSSAELKQLHELASEIGLTCLVELYDPTNLESVLASGAKLVGVNNRNLHTMQVDLGHCLEVHNSIPEEIVFVGESGIKTNQDAERLRSSGVDAMLVGESLMRQDDILLAVKSLLGK